MMASLTPLIGEISTSGPVLDVIRPVGTCPGRGIILHTLPHSGRIYPEAFQTAARQIMPELRGSEDAWVDLLIGFDVALTSDAVRDGVGGLRANHARAFVDVNRHEFELDPRLMNGALPPEALSKSRQVVAGFGVVHRCLRAGQDIYGSRLSMDEVEERVRKVYRPYHETLRGLILMARQAEQRVIILDWHSMPSQAAHADIVLGDCNGTSVSRPLRSDLLEALKASGFSVSLNHPFAGGFTTRTYGQPDNGVEVIQIELNRALYMDEARIRPLAGFDVLKLSLAEVLRNTDLALTKAVTGA